MIQSVKKRYDESKDSSDSEVNIDFNQAHSSLSESLQDVKTDI